MLGDLSNILDVLISVVMNFSRNATRLILISFQVLDLFCRCSKFSTDNPAQKMFKTAYL